ncbi:MAG: hypothetical protein MZV49_06275 [Rhodopseudomonas palustris]|nr:hypothetical protein [Rhodopseudomonas palustris]
MVRFLATLAVFALWAAVPKGAPAGKKRVLTGLKIGAAVLLLVLVALFRGRGPDGVTTWLPDVLVGHPGDDRLVLSRREPALPGLPRRPHGPGRGRRGDDGSLHRRPPRRAGLPGTRQRPPRRRRPVRLARRRRHGRHAGGNGLSAGDGGGRAGAAGPVLAVLGATLLGAGFLLRPLTASARSKGTESYTLATAGLCALAFLLFYVVLDVYKESGRRRACGPGRAQSPSWPTCCRASSPTPRPSWAGCCPSTSAGSCGRSPGPGACRGCSTRPL